MMVVRRLYLMQGRFHCYSWPDSSHCCDVPLVPGNSSISYKVCMHDTHYMLLFLLDVHDDHVMRPGKGNQMISQCVEVVDWDSL